MNSSPALSSTTTLSTGEVARLAGEALRIPTDLMEEGDMVTEGRVVPAGIKYSLLT